MKYKLYENRLDTNDVLEKFLSNRGIDDVKKYISLGCSAEISYSKLCNIENAVDVYVKHLVKNNKIGILVDCDVDGYTSAASMFSYTKRQNENYPVYYILHKDSKTHGLSDDVSIEDGTKLLIIPDAGTNDEEQCRKLIEDGIVEDIIILD